MKFRPLAFAMCVLSLSWIVPLGFGSDLRVPACSAERDRFQGGAIADRDAFGLVECDQPGALQHPETSTDGFERQSEPVSEIGTGEKEGEGGSAASRVSSPAGKLCGEIEYRACDAFDSGLAPEEQGMLLCTAQHLA